MSTENTTYEEANDNLKNMNNFLAEKNNNNEPPTEEDIKKLQKYVEDYVNHGVIEPTTSNENVPNQPSSWEKILEYSGDVNEVVVKAMDSVPTPPQSVSNITNFIEWGKKIATSTTNASDDVGAGESVTQAVVSNAAALLTTGVAGVALGSVLAPFMLANPVNAIFLGEMSGEILDQVYDDIDNAVDSYFENGSEYFEALGTISKYYMEKFNDELASPLGAAPGLAGLAGLLDLFKNSQNQSVAPPRRDPISVDLDNDGIETVSSEDGVYFDLDASGTAEKTPLRQDYAGQAGWIKRNYCPQISLINLKFNIAA